FRGRRGGEGRREAVRVRLGPAEAETLRPRDAGSDDGVEFALAFHAFGDHGGADLSGELGDGLREAAPGVVDVDVTGDRLVDLDELRRQLQHVGERREAGADVVDGDAHAPRPTRYERIVERAVVSY